MDNTLKSLYLTYLSIFDSSEYYTDIVIYCHIVLFNLDIEMWMDVAYWPDILLEDDDVTSSDIVFISMIVEGDMLDIVKVIVLFSTSKLRVNVAWYCLQIGCCRGRDVGLIEGDYVVFY